MRSLKSAWVISLGLMLILSGCKASLIDVNKELVEEVELDFVRFSDDKYGLELEYPKYYGEPVVEEIAGERGSRFRMQFVFEKEGVTGSFVVYLVGSSEDFAAQNPLERDFYKGGVRIEEVCREKEKIWPLAVMFGERCDILQGKVFLSGAWTELWSNSLENVMIMHDSERGEAVQMGLMVPLSFLSKTGEEGVAKMLKAMDSWKAEKSLVDELKVFRVVSESVKFK